MDSHFFNRKDDISSWGEGECNQSSLCTYLPTELWWKMYQKEKRTATATGLSYVRVIEATDLKIKTRKWSLDTFTWVRVGWIHQRQNQRTRGNLCDKVSRWVYRILNNLHTARLYWLCSIQVEFVIDIWFKRLISGKRSAMAVNGLQICDHNCRIADWLLLNSYTIQCLLLEALHRTLSTHLSSGNTFSN